MNIERHTYIAINNEVKRVSYTYKRFGIEVYAVWTPNSTLYTTSINAGITHQVAVECQPLDIFHDTVIADMVQMITSALDSINATISTDIRDIQRSIQDTE
jgi:hypothetical protein